YSLDRVLHAVEIGEGRIDLDGPVRENPAQPLVPAGIDQRRFADRIDHPFRSRGIEGFVLATGEEILLEAHLLLGRARIDLREEIEDVGVFLGHGSLSSGAIRSPVTPFYQLPDIAVVPFTRQRSLSIAIKADVPPPSEPFALRCSID